MIFFKIVFALLFAIGAYNFIDAAMDLYLKGGVYSCSDKLDNPPDIHRQCERLTKGQWWAK